MFDRFTEHARMTMNLARQEALRCHHDYIGTEHVLFGLVEEPRGVAVQVLRDLGVDPRKVRTDLEKIVQHGSNPVTMGQLPFTPRAKRVLELSLEEAQSFGHRHIGTEHLLLGLVREEEGIAGKVLVQGMGLTLDRVRAKVLERVPAGPNAAAPPPAPGRDRGSRLRWLGLLGLLGLLGFVDTRLGYLGFLGFLGFLGMATPGDGRERR